MPSISKVRLNSPKNTCQTASPRCQTNERARILQRFKPTCEREERFPAFGGLFSRARTGHASLVTRSPRLANSKNDQRRFQRKQKPPALSFDPEKQGIALRNSKCEYYRRPFCQKRAIPPDFLIGDTFSTPRDAQKIRDRPAFYGFGPKWAILGQHRSQARSGHALRSTASNGGHRKSNVSHCTHQIAAQKLLDSAVTGRYPAISDNRRTHLGRAALNKCPVSSALCRRAATGCHRYGGSVISRPLAKGAPNANDQRLLPTLSAFTETSRYNPGSVLDR